MECPILLSTNEIPEWFHRPREWRNPYYPKSQGSETCFSVDTTYNLVCKLLGKNHRFTVRKGAQSRLGFRQAHFCLHIFVWNICMYKDCHSYVSNLHCKVKCAKNPWLLCRGFDSFPPCAFLSCLSFLLWDFDPLITRIDNSQRPEFWDVFASEQGHRHSHSRDWRKGETFTLVDGVLI